MKELPFWRRQVGLNTQEWATIAPNGDIRFTFGAMLRGTRGPRCDRCGANLLNEQGLVVASFALDRPLVGYIECSVCCTRNIRRLLHPGAQRTMWGS